MDISRIDQSVANEAATLLELSHRIHANPEVRFEEIKASGWLADVLEARGFTVSRAVAGLPTAFKAELTGGAGPGPTIAVLAEYDALPGLGHACGHNIIATMGVGAGLALAPLMRDLPGKLVVMGTPAEEGGGGKVIMLNEGVFDGVEAAVMIHPWIYNQVTMPMLASTRWSIGYHGVPAHAAAAPHLGVNALDAVRLAFAGLDALRQQMRADARVHAMITRGGDAVNVIPEYAELMLVARAADNAYLFDTLVPRLEGVFEGAARMTGTRLELRPEPIRYAAMRFNEPLEALYARHAERRGRPITPLDPSAGTGSSDMGNISQALPSLHAMIAIDDRAMPHTAPFAVAAGSKRGEEAVLDGAAILAGMAADLLRDPELLDAAKADFAARG
jgi:amidohydrolase